jgi:hypothetical protein
VTIQGRPRVGYWAAYYINRDGSWSVACDALGRIIRCETEKLALSVARYRRRRLQPLRERNPRASGRPLGGSANGAQPILMRDALDHATGPQRKSPRRPLVTREGHSITAHYANEPSLSDQAPPMQRATINQLSSETALPNRSRIAECRRKSQNIVALVPREPPTRRTAVCP